MLMENTIQVKDQSRLKYIFDLKGSKVDRKVKGKTTSKTTLKDINFLMASRENQGFTLTTVEDKIQFHATLQRDVDFLRKHGLMDYSLLLGIEKVKNAKYRSYRTQSKQGTSKNLYKELKSEAGHVGRMKSQSLTEMNTTHSDTLYKEVQNSHMFYGAANDRIFHVAIIDYL